MRTVILVTSVLMVIIKVLRTEEGTRSEKIAFLVRGILGRKTQKLRHEGRHQLALTVG